jgi:hypothetical protein
MEAPTLISETTSQRMASKARIRNLSGEACASSGTGFSLSVFEFRGSTKKIKSHRLKPVPHENRV